jgi:2-polyprenyl-3-methyl-5-hydroxy-6-metoxy-1,4-benzoquinol methylase
LETTVIKHIILETVLTQVRRQLLQAATAAASESHDVDDALTAFFCALAQQCFLNEYVFAQRDEETRLALRLRDALLQRLAAGGAVAVLWLAAVAAYFPLHTLPQPERLLRDRRRGPVAALLRQQVTVPLEEARDRSAIPVLTPVKDHTSLQVMRQYEENPYPRWIFSPLTVFAADRAQGKIDDGGKVSAGEIKPSPAEILIAGCGTGQHSVQVAQLFPDARILAVDISRPSLAYAWRKTRELGIGNIEYAQADILELGDIGRSFDRIDAIGVLHHLADPDAGWRVLLSLLRPDGEMTVGLYSAAARRVIVEARRYIADRGYRPTAADIRKCRQEMIRDQGARRWQALYSAQDFYTTSGCRDLLFNVTEHQYTIPRIAKFLDDNELTFLGFQFENSSAIDAFAREFREFKDSNALTNLDHWQAFEVANPDLFWSMYLFSLCKNRLGSL